MLIVALTVAAEPAAEASSEFGGVLMGLVLGVVFGVLVLIDAFRSRSGDDPAHSVHEHETSDDAPDDDDEHVGLGAQGGP